MPAYIKIGDIKGESSKDPDTFNFNFDASVVADDSRHDKWADLISVGQGSSKSGHAGDFSGGTGAEAPDTIPAEEFTMGYTEVEWTY